MSEASDYLEKALLDYLFSKAGFAQPTIYLALCTTTVVDNDTGSTITEANYTSYARLVTAGGDWNATTLGTGILDNAVEMAFPAATGGSSTVTDVALVDASSAGNLLAYTPLAASLAVTSGVTPKFAAGALTIALA